MEPMMTAQQVADKLQVNEQTVRRWLRDGELGGYQLGTGGGRSEWRVSEEDLAAFLERRRNREDTGKAAA